MIDKENLWISYPQSHILFIKNRYLTSILFLRKGEDTINQQISEGGIKMEDVEKMVKLRNPKQITWKQINHPDILPGYLISPQGYIKAEGIDDKDAITSPSYHSTNGYDFMLLNNKDMNLQLFPLDDIIAMAYIDIPKSLQYKKVKVSHINGDTRDISLENMEWVEDIEEWRVCTYPGVKPDMYEVSSWGRLRNKKRNSIIGGGLHKKGYITHTLMSVSNDDKYKITWKLLHQLVAWEFLKHTMKLIDVNNDDRIEINHIDCVKTHNYPKNIEYVSGVENRKHEILVEKNPSCEEHPLAKLTNREVERICEIIVKNKKRITPIMNDLKNEGIDASIGTVLEIIKKQSWKPISDKYFSKDDFRKLLKASEVNEICKALILYDKNVDKVWDWFNKTHDIKVTKRTIQRILTKDIWCKVSKEYF